MERTPLAKFVIGILVIAGVLIAARLILDALGWWAGGAGLGVVGSRGREAGVPAVHPVLLTARGEQAERFAGWEGVVDAAGEPPVRVGQRCSFSLCASAAVRATIQPFRPATAAAVHPR